MVTYVLISVALAVEDIPLDIHTRDIPRIIKVQNSNIQMHLLCFRNVDTNIQRSK